jgi:hypothetical protein
MTGNQVNLTCQVKKFYPQILQLTWLENGNVSRTETASTLTENKDGTYNQTSWLLVNSSAHRESVVFTCQVEHDGQPAAIRKLTLQGTDTTPGKTPPQLTSSFKKKFYLFLHVKSSIHSYYRKIHKSTRYTI